MTTLTAVRPHPHQMPDQATAGCPSSLSVEESIELLERTHGRALRRYLAAQMAGDHRQAEDIYQETLIRAWKHPEERDSEGRYGRNWLFTVGRRLCIDHYRATQRRPVEVSHDSIVELAQPKDDVERMLSIDQMRGAMSTLSPAHREVIHQMYFLDRPAAEVAERLGVPVGTVRSRTYYAVRQLRSVLLGNDTSELLAS
jgi:RNA polymerase sigma-70 factor, ECF subfamily